MKKKYKIGIGIVLIIVSINIAWYLAIYKKYDKYIEKVNKNEIGVNYRRDEDGTHYNVKVPNYLSLDGNLAVTEKDDKYGLIIWPNVLKGDYDYGATITENNEVHMIKIDENINVIGKYDDSKISLVNKYKDKLKGLLNKANSTWGVLKK